jgi:hypothetical protein
MRTRPKIAAWAATCLLAAPTALWAADAAHPTVVEEYQSQGCNSCPPANANLNAIAGRTDVLALSFAVTYWDRLGWKDTFARPAYTERQWDYARAGGRSTVYTPQMIVNGTGVLVGNRAAALEAALKRYDRGTGGPEIAWSGRQLRLSGPAKGPSATVWLVRYDPRQLDVHVGAGENRGRVLPHRNVVKGLVRLGAWNGGRRSYHLPGSPDPVLKTAVLVQQGKGGPIVAASRMP